MSESVCWIEDIAATKVLDILGSQCLLGLLPSNYDNCGHVATCWLCLAVTVHFEELQLDAEGHWEIPPVTPPATRCRSLWTPTSEPAGDVEAAYPNSS